MQHKESDGWNSFKSKSIILDILKKEGQPTRYIASTKSKYPMKIPKQHWGILILSVQKLFLKIEQNNLMKNKMEQGISRRIGILVLLNQQRKKPRLLIKV